MSHGLSGQEKASLCVMFSSKGWWWELPNPQAGGEPITLFVFKYPRLWKCTGSHLPCLSLDKTLLQNNSNYSVDSGGSGQLSRHLSWFSPCSVEIAQGCPASGSAEGQCCLHLALLKPELSIQSSDWQKIQNRNKWGLVCKVISCAKWSATPYKASLNSAWKVTTI